MKTTLDIDDALVTRAKALAAAERTTLTRLVEEGLQLRLRADRRVVRRKGTPLPVHHGAGLKPGIDPCSNRAMLDAADDDA